MFVFTMNVVWACIFGRIEPAPGYDDSPVWERQTSEGTAVELTCKNDKQIHAETLIHTKYSIFNFSLMKASSAWQNFVI